MEAPTLKTHTVRCALRSISLLLPSLLLGACGVEPDPTGPAPGGGSTFAHPSGIDRPGGTTPSTAGPGSVEPGTGASAEGGLATGSLEPSTTGTAPASTASGGATVGSAAGPGPSPTGPSPTDPGPQEPAGPDVTDGGPGGGASEVSDAGPNEAPPEEEGPPPCTGKPGSKRGKSEETVSARRSFVYYAPKDLDPNRPVPLVIVPHGYTQSGQEMFEITKYSDIADREGFVVAFPDGAPGSVGPWDVGRGVCGAGTFVPGSGDDQKFVDEIIAFAEADQCIDREHIFMTGWSMGGYLSNHSGCLRDDIRAIGPHSGGTHDLSDCPVGPKPVILFHFDPDGLIDYDCGVKARDQWLAHNGCRAESPEVREVKGGRCEYYQGCPEDGQVAMCTFEIPRNHRADFLAGHAWSGGNPQAWSIAETESAAELGWAFFQAHAW